MSISTWAQNYLYFKVKNDCAPCELERKRERVEADGEACTGARSTLLCVVHLLDPPKKLNANGRAAEAALSGRAATNGTSSPGAAVTTCLRACGGG